MHNRAVCDPEIKAQIHNMLQRVMVFVFNVAHSLAGRKAVGVCVCVCGRRRGGVGGCIPRISGSNCGSICCSARINTPVELLAARHRGLKRERRWSPRARPDHRRSPSLRSPSSVVTCCGWAKEYVEEVRGWRRREDGETNAKKRWDEMREAASADLMPASPLNTRV